MSYDIISPTVTILDDNGKIDIEGNKKVIEFLLKGGVTGVAPLGSTGEFTEFTVDEKLELIGLYVEMCKGKVPVIAGTSARNFNETLDLAKKAVALGVDGVLVLPPYYFGISQEEVYDWYSEMARNLNGNIYIYNFPDRTGFNIAPETIVKLVENHTNIVGIKDSVANPENTKGYIYAVKKVKPDFKVYSGFDNQFTSNILAGRDGNISAFSNIVPELWASWIKAAENKDFDEVKRIQAKVDSLMPLYAIKANFSRLFKVLMKERGVEINTKSIFPFKDLTDEEVEQGKKILQSVIG